MHNFSRSKPALNIFMGPSQMSQTILNWGFLPKKKSEKS